MQGLQLKIAPLAASFAGLNQPVEFAVHASGKLAPALTTAAGGEKCGIPRLAPAQPAKESRTLCVTAQPIKAQLYGLGLPYGGAYQL
jgi:hypothetical protein